VDQGAPPATAKRVAVVVLAAVAVLVVMTAVIWTSRRSHSQCEPLTHVAYPFDPADDRQVVAYASDVFVGSVVGREAILAVVTPAPSGPRRFSVSRLQVQVLDSLKGRAAGTVTVDQYAGVTIEGCVLAVAGDGLVLPGQTALFVAVYAPTSATYVLPAGAFSHLDLPDDASRATAEARFAAALGASPAAGSPLARAALPTTTDSVPTWGPAVSS
jgi:hypothetical protein